MRRRGPCSAQRVLGDARESDDLARQLAVGVEHFERQPSGGTAATGTTNSYLKVVSVVSGATGLCSPSLVPLLRRSIRSGFSSLCGMGFDGTANSTEQIHPFARDGAPRRRRGHRRELANHARVRLGVGSSQWFEV